VIIRIIIKKYYYRQHCLKLHQVQKQGEESQSEEKFQSGEESQSEDASSIMTVLFIGDRGSLPVRYVGGSQLGVARFQLSLGELVGSLLGVCFGNGEVLGTLLRFRLSLGELVASLL
jgi:hypothetical protein